MVQTEEGFKNEENARQLVQKELAVMKDEIKNLKVGSGSTVWSEASTRARLGSGTYAQPPPLSSRWTETWIPRRIELKGWVTDFTERKSLGITDMETTKFQNDLERMVAAACPKMR